MYQQTIGDYAKPLQIVYVAQNIIDGIVSFQGDISYEFFINIMLPYHPWYFSHSLQYEE